MDLHSRTQAFNEMLVKVIEHFDHEDHTTNEEVSRKIQAAIGEYDEFLTMVKKQKTKVV